MHTQVGIIDQHPQNKVVEQVDVVLPHLTVIVLGDALHVESVVLCDLSGLVVASHQLDVPCVLHLQQAQESDGLYTLAPSIHIVTQEYIVRIRNHSSYFEQLDQIIKLAMDIPYYCLRTAHIHYVLFFYQNLLHF
jgi:hypothetical protein